MLCKNGYRNKISSLITISDDIQNLENFDYIYLNYKFDSSMKNTGFFRTRCFHEFVKNMVLTLLKKEKINYSKLPKFQKKLYAMIEPLIPEKDMIKFYVSQKNCDKLCELVENNLINNEYNEIIKNVKYGECFMCYTKNSYYVSLSCNHIFNICKTCKEQSHVFVSNCPLCRKKTTSIDRVYIVG